MPRGRGQRGSRWPTANSHRSHGNAPARSAITTSSSRTSRGHRRRPASNSLSSRRPSLAASEQDGTLHCGPKQTPTARRADVGHDGDLRSGNDANSPTKEPNDSTASFEGFGDVSPEQEEVIMAIDVKTQQTIGCAYYIAHTEKLYFFEDCKQGNKAIIDQCKSVSPTVVILPTRIDDEILEQLDPEQHGRVSGVDEENDPWRLPYNLELRASREFSYEGSMEKLLNLDFRQSGGPAVHFSVPGDIIPSNPFEHELEDSYGRHGRLLRLSGMIDLSCRLTVGCAGAVLSYIARRRSTGFLPGDESANDVFRISAVEMVSLQGTMYVHMSLKRRETDLPLRFINVDTIRSLHIVETECHPSFQKQGGSSKSKSGAKEGLSIYGLFHHLARTPQGKLLLRQYFLRPTVNPDVIHERLETVSVFLHPRNISLLDDLTNHLKHVKNMRTVLRNLRKGFQSAHRNATSTVPAWSTLIGFSYHTLQIQNTISEMHGADTLQIRNRILDNFLTDRIARVGQSVAEIVDLGESNNQGRAVVCQHVDEHLDALKHQYDGLDSILQEVSKHIQRSMPAIVASEDLDCKVDVGYFPRIGFVVIVSEGFSPIVEQAMNELDRPWNRYFSADNSVYFKSQEMEEMDEKFGDIWYTISDREIEIIHDLAQRILEQEKDLVAISDICGELDALVALAKGALLYNLTRPVMSAENVIVIKQGRHLLHELSVPSYVPNDTRVVGGNEDAGPHDAESEEELLGPSMLVMTGPNYSGKSVYLKQVALTVYMAHVGSFVPAEEAVIGITDKILTRVTSKETVNKMASAFALDVQQISMAMSLATPRSLILIDEFGKGTSPIGEIIATVYRLISDDTADGASLCGGVLQHFLDLANQCPKVLVATHFHEIFENGFLPPQPQLEFGHMEVLVDKEAATAENQLTYLYSFQSGRSTSTFGTMCAAMNGIEADTVSRAESLILMDARGEDVVASCSIISEVEATDLEVAEVISRKFVATDVPANADVRHWLKTILENVGLSHQQE